MLVTVTNTSGAAMNGAATYTSGSGTATVLATGGARSNPLPFPFGHIGELAASGTKQLPVHPRDFRYKPVPWVSMEPGEEWNQLVQAGKVTLAFASQATRNDVEELFLGDDTQFSL